MKVKIFIQGQKQFIQAQMLLVVVVLLLLVQMLLLARRGSATGLDARVASV